VIAGIVVGLKVVGAAFAWFYAACLPEGQAYNSDKNEQCEKLGQPLGHWVPPFPTIAQKPRMGAWNAHSKSVFAAVALAGQLWYLTAARPVAPNEGAAKR
jgi:hypothetical protein